MKILANYNIKGGVGKTASAVNLAYLAARDGYRTCLWDLDPQGAASFYYRVKPKVKGGGTGLLKRKRELEDVVKATDFDNLDLIPADFSYRNLDTDLDATSVGKPTRQLLKLMRPLSAEYDLLFIDTAPSISLVSENIFHAANALLVPVIPTTLSLRTYKQLLKHLAKNPAPDLKLLPFFSMADQRKRLHREIIEAFPNTYPEALSTVIPSASAVELMGVRREPVPVFDPQSSAAVAFEALWAEVCDRLNL